MNIKIDNKTLFWYHYPNIHWSTIFYNHFFRHFRKMAIFFCENILTFIVRALYYPFKRLRQIRTKNRKQDQKFFKFKIKNAKQIKKCITQHDGWICFVIHFCCLDCSSACSINHLNKDAKVRP